LEKGHESFDDAKKYYQDNFYLGRSRLMSNDVTKKIMGMIVEEYRSFYGWK